MNMASMMRHLLSPNANEWHAAAELRESDQPIRLPPTVEANELPPEFEDVLEVQVLGYRERVTHLYGHQLHVLDPVWTVVPKDR
jgi:hypothetical protein